MGRKKKHKTPKTPKRDNSFYTPFKSALSKLRHATKQKELLASKTTRPSPKREPKKQLSDDALFQNAMEDVAPFDRKTAPMPKHPTPPPARLASFEDGEVLAELADLIAGVVPFEISDTDEYIQGIAKGLDKRLLKKLKRGEFSIQGHLDLHGMNRQEARKAVEDFLAESRKYRKRCVLLICGRGHHSKGKTPVLKTQLARWLTRGKMGKNILAFCSAQPHDGGAGAIYVLLRK